MNDWVFWILWMIQYFIDLQMYILVIFVLKFLFLLWKEAVLSNLKYNYEKTLFVKFLMYTRFNAVTFCMWSFQEPVLRGKNVSGEEWLLWYRQTHMPCFSILVLPLVRIPSLIPPLYAIFHVCSWSPWTQDGYHVSLSWSPTERVQWSVISG